jgi:hypothetical protein
MRVMCMRNCHDLRNYQYGEGLRHATTKKYLNKIIHKHLIGNMNSLSNSLMMGMLKCRQDVVYLHHQPGQ